jgi:hypothetical protein
MKIKTGLAFAAAALTIGAPAFAKTSVQGGQNACKAAFAAQTPAPTSIRLDSAGGIRVSNDVLVYAYTVKTPATEKPSAVTCTVDRKTNGATLSSDAGQVTAAK